MKLYGFEKHENMDLRREDMIFNHDETMKLIMDLAMN